MMSAGHFLVGGGGAGGDGGGHVDTQIGNL